MKVYVVEVGAYSDRYISAIFVSRELAEQYVIETARNGWGGIPWKQPQGPFPDPVGQPFQDWHREAERLMGNWGEFGDVDEYELWDALPVVVTETP